MSSLSGLGTRRRGSAGLRLPVLPIFSWLFISLALGLLMLELLRFSQQAQRFAADLEVAGVPIGGLTSGDAAALLERTYNAPLTLWYQDSPIQLDPTALGFRTNREAMLAQARAGSAGEGAFWGRFFNYLTGQQNISTLDIPLSADYQENALRQFVTELAMRYDRPPGAAGYDVTTLTFRPGGAGYQLDTEAAFQVIDSALRNPNRREVALPVITTDGSRVGISTLRELIIGYLDSQGFVHDGQNSVASVFILDLETGEEVNINSDVAFSAASTVKMGILIDYFRSLLFAPSADEAFLMAQSVLCSNNSSSNLIMQIIGRDDIFRGIASVTNTMQTIGARNTFITAPFYLGVPGQQLGSIPAPSTRPNANFNTGADPFNQTTTEDLGTMLSMVYDCARYGSGLMTVYTDGEFTQSECQQILNLMSANDLERLLQGGLPPDARIAHKNGWLENVHGDAGIVFPPNGNDYIIAVYVWENAQFFSYTRAWPLIEGISRAAWNYFNVEAPLVSPRTDLPDQAVACDAFSPPYGQVNLNDINAWRGGG
jgi:beta-lactamase class A